MSDLIYEWTQNVCPGDQSQAINMLNATVNYKSIKIEILNLNY